MGSQNYGIMGSGTLKLWGQVPYNKKAPKLFHQQKNAREGELL